MTSYKSIKLIHTEIVFIVHSECKKKKKVKCNYPNIEGATGSGNSKEEKGSEKTALKIFFVQLMEMIFPFEISHLSRNNNFTAVDQVLTSIVSLRR